MEEQLMSINEFNQPKVAKGIDALYHLIIRLIIMRKGDNKSHPDMGVDIISYRYMDIDDIDQLRSEIISQMETYMPILTAVDVDLTYISENKSLGVSIYVNNEVYYIFDVDFEKNTVLLRDL